MKQYLLDTNICIYFLKNQYGVAEHIKAVGNKNCFISDITLAELYILVLQIADKKNIR